MQSNNRRKAQGAVPQSMAAAYAHNSKVAEYARSGVSKQQPRADAHEHSLRSQQSVKTQQSSQGTQHVKIDLVQSARNKGEDQLEQLNRHTAIPDYGDSGIPVTSPVKLNAAAHEQEAQPKSAQRRDGTATTFLPFAELDSIEPIEKVKDIDYSDDEEANAIADEREDLDRQQSRQKDATDHQRNDDNEQADVVVRSTMGQFFEEDDEEQLKLEFLQRSSPSKKWQGGIQGSKNSQQRSSMKERHREEADDDKMLSNNFLIETKSNSRELLSQDGGGGGRFYFNQGDKSQSSGMEGLKNTLAGHGTVSAANYANGYRDVFYLMDKFKEESKGQGTTDICMLFSFWQSNFATMSAQQMKHLLTSSNVEDRQQHTSQSLINFNSKSFNNKTIGYNHDGRTPQQMSMNEAEGDNDEQHGADEPDEHAMLVNDRFNMKHRRAIDSLEPSPISQMRNQEYTDDMIDEGQQAMDERGDSDNRKHLAAENSLEQRLEMAAGGRQHAKLNSINTQKGSNHEQRNNVLVPKLTLDGSGKNRTGSSDHSKFNQPQMDSLLYSQKVKLDRDRNINEIQLGNVKHQVMKGHNMHGLQGTRASLGGGVGNQSLTNTSNFSGGQLGGYYPFRGEMADRNQLSIEVMNITPIIEEEANNGGYPNDKRLSSGIHEEGTQSSVSEDKRNRHTDRLNQDPSGSGKQSGAQAQRAQDQFSFVKELDYLAGRSSKVEHHDNYAIDLLADADPTEQGTHDTPQMNQHKEDEMSENLDERVLVNDLQQLDNRFSLDGVDTNLKIGEKRLSDQLLLQIASNKTPVQKGRKTRVDHEMSTPVLAEYMSQHYRSAETPLFNVFKSMDTRQLPLNEQKRLVKCREKLRQDFERYDGFINVLSMVASHNCSLPITRMCQNLPIVMRLDQQPRLQALNSSATAIRKILPRELSQLSPILERKRSSAYQRSSLPVISQNIKTIMYEFLSGINSKRITGRGVCDKQHASSPRQPATSNINIVGFTDQLSSIDRSDQQNDDAEDDMLHELDADGQPQKNQVRLLKNDDEQYKERERRNLSKYIELAPTSQERTPDATSGAYSAPPAQSKQISNNWVEWKSSKSKNRMSRKSRHEQNNQFNKITEAVTFTVEDNKEQAAANGPVVKETASQRISRHKKSKPRRGRKHANDSSKSKSKTRGLSNNLGFTQLEKALESEINMNDDIENIFKMIDEGENELNQFISKEEERYNQNFETKMNEVERNLQNSRRDNSNNRLQFDSTAAITATLRDNSQGAALTANLHQNQHHNSISTSNNSFQFKPLTAKAKDGNMTVKTSQPQQMYGVVVPQKAQQNRTRGVIKGTNNLNNSSTSSSSTSSSQRSSFYDNKSPKLNLKSISEIDAKTAGSYQKVKTTMNKRLLHHNNTQNPMHAVLTDRGPNLNFDNRLDMGRNGQSELTGTNNGQYVDKKLAPALNLNLKALHERSNERQASLASCHSNGPLSSGMNGSYTQNKGSAFQFTNNLINRSSAAVVGAYHNQNQTVHQHQNSSLSRIIKPNKVSSVLSHTGAFSNPSPSNGHGNLHKSNLHGSNQKTIDNKSSRSKDPMRTVLPNQNHYQNTQSGYLHGNGQYQGSQQNSYRTITHGGGSVSNTGGSQNVILQKLKSTQMNRGATTNSSHNQNTQSLRQNMANTNTVAVNQLFLQTSQEYPLSHRCMPSNKHQSTMNSVITPKSFIKTTALKTTRKDDGDMDGDNLSPHHKQILSSTHQTADMQPMLRQINNEQQRSHKRNGVKQATLASEQIIEDIKSSPIQRQLFSDEKHQLQPQELVAQNSVENPIDNKYLLQNNAVDTPEQATTSYSNNNPLSTTNQYKHSSDGKHGTAISIKNVKQSNSLQTGKASSRPAGQSFTLAAQNDKIKNMWNRTDKPQESVDSAQGRNPEPLLKQVRLRVKSLKKPDEMLQENFNSSIGIASDKIIDGAKSSVSSMGEAASTSTNGQRRLKLKFNKIRNINQQQQQKSHRDEAKPAEDAEAPQEAEVSSPSGKQMSAKKTIDKRRDRGTRGLRNQQLQSQGQNTVESMQNQNLAATITSSSAKSIGSNQNNRVAATAQQKAAKHNMYAAHKSAQSTGLAKRQTANQLNVKPIGLSTVSSVKLESADNTTKISARNSLKNRGRERESKIQAENSSYNQGPDQVQTILIDQNPQADKIDSHKSLVQNQYYASSFTNNMNAGNKLSARATMPTRSAQKQNNAAANVHISQIDDNSLQRTNDLSQHGVASGKVRLYQPSNKTSMSAVVDAQNNSQSLQQQDIDVKQFATSNLRGAADERQANGAMIQPQDVVQQVKANDNDRLIELLINEYKRKKGKTLNRDQMNSIEQLTVLMTFWHESLNAKRILHKLNLKAQQSFNGSNQNKADTGRTNGSMQQRLSEKERHLLEFLKGTNRENLLKLGKDSATRNYGELAILTESQLAHEIVRYLRLDNIAIQWYLRQQLPGKPNE